MSGLDPNIVLGAFLSILIAVLAFFFRREREFGTLQASLKALHKRIDRIERSLNGYKEAVDE